MGTGKFILGSEEQLVIAKLLSFRGWQGSIKISASADQFISD